MYAKFYFIANLDGQDIVISPSTRIENEYRVLT